MAARNRKPTEFHETSFWQSYSDMMAGVLLMFILIICGTLFVLMQVKNSYDASEIELQQREEELEQAIQENLGYLDLTEEQSQLLLDQQTQLDDQQTQLDDQQTKLDEQQLTLEEQQAALDEALAQLEEQQAALAASQTLLALQQDELDEKEAQISLQTNALESQQLQLEQIIGVKRELIAALSDEFSNSSLSIAIDEQTGAITLDSSIIFDYDSADLSAEGQRTLSMFLPRYFDVVLSDKYIDYISEIIIEGHTDNHGGYDYNLALSQDRAEAVAAYCLGEDASLFPASTMDRIRSLVSVTGRSWSNPIYTAAGTVDEDASRRVEIKFRLSDEEMISEMLEVLDQYEPSATPAPAAPAATGEQAVAP